MLEDLGSNPHLNPVGEGGFISGGGVMQVCPPIFLSLAGKK